LLYVVRSGFNILTFKLTCVGFVNKIIKIKLLCVENGMMTSLIAFSAPAAHGACYEWRRAGVADRNALRSRRRRALVTLRPEMQGNGRVSEKD
jgi:hypothetical protein